MNWAPILIGIAIICYTFATYIILLQVSSIRSMVKIPSFRNPHNTSVVALGFCVGITFATIGTVALCYL